MDATPEVALTSDDLRAVTGFAAACAESVIDLYETAHPADTRPRDAIDAARAFADGGRRGKALRDVAWAALRAAGETDTPAAEHAARAAMAAASAAYLHPLANATQVRHILGAAAHAARSSELAAGEEAAAAQLDEARRAATPVVVAVLERYPAAPPGGGRVGELLRELDAALRPR
ncbi:putative immunity protein [Actinomycetospora straminea]|uniref:putative immunity protein n=1 Tax=Actinomycetospora straminea TaxID=663607 RepID=UPI0030824B0E